MSSSNSKIFTNEKFIDAYLKEARKCKEVLNFWKRFNFWQINVPADR